MSYHYRLGSVPTTNAPAPCGGEWHYSVGDAQPRCTFRSADAAARLALRELSLPYSRGVAYAVVTRNMVPVFAVTRDGALIAVGGCGSPCCTVRDGHVHVADPCGTSRLGRPIGRVALGDPFTPRYKQIPFTDRGDVNYAFGNYEGGDIFDGGGPVDGNAQQLAGLDGILAVM